MTKQAKKSHKKKSETIRRMDTFITRLWLNKKKEFNIELDLCPDAVAVLSDEITKLITSTTILAIEEKRNKKTLTESNVSDAFWRNNNLLWADCHAAAVRAVERS